MIKLKDMLELAYSQVGYEEEPPGSNLTKYNRAYYGYNQPAEWCAIWCWWLCWKLGDADFYGGGNRFACCDDLQDWASAHDRMADTPHVGDWILFDWDNSGDADHVGLVVEVHDGYVTTIEGNTNNRVEKRERSEHILGYVRNQYESGEEPQEEEEMLFDDLPELFNGCTGAAVVSWQGIVDADPDGIFGPETERKTIEKQKEWFNDTAEHDGIVGPKTWKKGLYSLT